MFVIFHKHVRYRHRNILTPLGGKNNCLNSVRRTLNMWMKTMPLSSIQEFKDSMYLLTVDYPTPSLGCKGSESSQSHPSRWLNRTQQGSRVRIRHISQLKALRRGKGHWGEPLRGIKEVEEIQIYYTINYHK